MSAARGVLLSKNVRIAVVTGGRFPSQQVSALAPNMHFTRAPGNVVLAWWLVRNPVPARSAFERQIAVSVLPQRSGFEHLGRPVKIESLQMPQAIWVFCLEITLLAWILRQIE